MALTGKQKLDFTLTLQTDDVKLFLAPVLPADTAQSTEL